MDQSPVITEPESPAVILGRAGGKAGRGESKKRSLASLRRAQKASVLARKRKQIEKNNQLLATA